MNILFVCAANRIRSRGAHKFFEKKFPQHNFRSCGSKPSFVEGTKKIFDDAQLISNELIDWADLILFMETENIKQTRSLLGSNVLAGKITDAWELPDMFDRWDDENLIDFLKRIDLNSWIDEMPKHPSVSNNDIEMLNRIRPQQFK